MKCRHCGRESGDGSVRGAWTALNDPDEVYYAGELFDMRPKLVALLSALVQDGVVPRARAIAIACPKVVNSETHLHNYVGRIRKRCVEKGIPWTIKIEHGGSLRLVEKPASKRGVC